MKKNMQLLRAMSEIRPQYIEDAGERTAKTGGITMRWRIAGGAAIAACFAVSAAVLMPGVQNALRESAASAKSPAVQTEETTAALMRTAEENETTAAAETALTEADYAAPALTLTTAETALLAENPVTEALTVQTAAAVQTEAQTAAAVQTEAPAVTTLAETSAPRTTTATGYNYEEGEAIWEAAWDKMNLEEMQDQLDSCDVSDEYHLIVVPNKILQKAYADGCEPNSRELYDRLLADLGEASYRIDDALWITDRILSHMCGWGYITEEELFAYTDAVANGEKLPDELIALSQDSAYLQSYRSASYEGFKEKRNPAFFRQCDYETQLNNDHEAQRKAGLLPNEPDPLGDDYLFPIICHWSAE